jgi:diaminohydroxyphosphoribosylaminopyrimidine deaminase/5-amino-6-(5-phosphoribosylamino)uracil reductase
MARQEIYMQRCFQLAELGSGNVAPNPVVGAVLVYNDRIIGEGYHQKYGQAHAEVNCINNVREQDKYLIQQSILFVSLEPCAHFGKTPPCADLIIANKIPEVIIGCRDSYAEVNGQGIEKLKAAGVSVTVGVLEKEALDLNKRFFTFHTKKRPYIILKWAQSKDKKIAGADHSRILISNEETNRLVHKWRSEEASILVGTNTALYDDPKLTTRLWHGNDPVRMVIDKELKLPHSLHLFDGTVKTIVFNTIKHHEEKNIFYYKLNGNDLIKELLEALHHLRIQSVLIEGGAKLLQSFIDKDLWDEARIIDNLQLRIENGIAAPVLKNDELFFEDQLLNNAIRYYKNLSAK